MKLSHTILFLFFTSVLRCIESGWIRVLSKTDTLEKHTQVYNLHATCLSYQAWRLTARFSPACFITYLQTCDLVGNNNNNNAVEVFLSCHFHFLFSVFGGGYRHFCALLSLGPAVLVGEVEGRGYQVWEGTLKKSYRKYMLKMLMFFFHICTLDTLLYLYRCYIFCLALEHFNVWI